MLARLLALALAVFPALAFAQSSPLPGFPPGVFQSRAPYASSSSVPPTVSFVSTYSDTGSDPQHGGTISIGNPAYIATRRVILLAAYGFNLPSLPVSACTINGVACDVATVTADSNGVQVALLSAVVPTGTTGVSATWTFANQIFANQPFAVYTVDNSLLSNPTSPVLAHKSNATAGITTDNTSVATLTGGFILSAAFVGGIATPPTVTSSTAGIADDYSLNAIEYGHANGTGASGASSATWVWGAGYAGGNSNVIALIAWH